VPPPPLEDAYDDFITNDNNLSFQIKDVTLLVKAEKSYFTRKSYFQVIPQHFFLIKIFHKSLGSNISW
jgi:hypothetical protein